MRNQLHSTPVAPRVGAFVAAAALALGALVLPATTASAQGNITIPSGTTMRVRVETPIRSDAVDVGSTFNARVLSPVVVRGQDAIPQGTMVVGTVTAVSNRKVFGQPSGVTLLVNSLESPSGVTVAVAGDIADLNGNSFTTVENMNVGTEVLFRTARSLSVGEDFYRGNQGGPQGDDFFDTPETVRQAQIVLRDLGYFNGAVDGRLSAPTRAAIGLFQRDQRLRQTGFLDRDTIDRLGLIGQTGQEVQPVTVISADALTRGGTLDVRVVTQTPSLGWQIFEDHFRQRDTLHIYVRGFRPSGPSGQAVQSKELTVSLAANEWNGLTRIVVHSSGRDITITSNDFNGGGVMTAQEAAALEAQITRVLTDYARVLGIRYNPANGQLLMTRANYRENEIELLFALNSLASSARLYTQILRSTDDPQAIRGATDLFVSQSNLVDRAVQRTRSGRAAGVGRQWEPIRTQFAQMTGVDNY